MLILFKELFSGFLKNTGGNVALITTVVSPVLLGAVAVGMDYAILNNQKSMLQDAADSAALASVKELSLSGSREETIKRVGEAYAIAAFSTGNSEADIANALAIDVQPDQQERKVTVNLSYTWKPFMAHIVKQGVTPIEVTATARLAGDSLTCIIGLMQPQRLAKSSIHLDNRSVVKADDCAVFSNSVSEYGLRADDNAQISASTICSAGGVLNFGFNRSATFSPEPITDCPKIEDPLIDRLPPTFGACSFTNSVVVSDATLNPGVYCGGLTISGNATASLEPGVYVIKDGPLNVIDSANLVGTGVTFYLTGSNSVFDFGADTTINLSAAETGNTAGILLFEDRNVNHSFEFNPFFLSHLPSDVRLHRITSNDARNLLGTIYLSKSILLIDADAPVADASAYTAIIAGRVWLREGPTLHLNANLTDTKVPVPDGILGTEPVLVE